MSHQTTDMTVMEDPTQRLSQGIRWVNDTGNVGKRHEVSRAPVLDGKELNVNVAAAFSRDTVVDHVDGRNIVFVDDGWVGHRKVKISKDGP